MSTSMRSMVSTMGICLLTLASGCRTPEKPIDDAAITRGVKARLATVFGPIEDRQVQQFDRGANLETISHISVSSVNGAVTLTGEVRGERAKAKAGELARGVAQVSSGWSRLTVCIRKSHVNSHVDPVVIVPRVGRTGPPICRGESGSVRAG